MPIYCYKCPECGRIYDDVQVKMVGTREIRCTCNVVWVNGDMVAQADSYHPIMNRDFNAEKPMVIDDWEPGYNIGLDEHYSSKQDLMDKIRRKGLYPKMHGGTSLVKANSGLYGDEEFRSNSNPSEPNTDAP